MKTAMQELRKHFLDVSHKNPHLTAYDVVFKIDEFIEKEKQQIVDACESGKRNNIDGDYYYKETFKQ